WPERFAPRDLRSTRSAQTRQSCYDRDVHVLIALADVGPGVQLEEALAQAGVDAKWDGAQADGPRGAAMYEVVIIDADRLGKKLASVAEAWRDTPSVPGIVAFGSSQIALDQAPSAK